MLQTHLSSWRPFLLSAFLSILASVLFDLKEVKWQKAKLVRDRRTGDTSNNFSPNHSILDCNGYIRYDNTPTITQHSTAMKGSRCMRTSSITPSHVTRQSRGLSLQDFKLHSDSQRLYRSRLPLRASCARYQFPTVAGRVSGSRVLLLCMHWRVNPLWWELNPKQHPFNLRGQYSSLDHPSKNGYRTALSSKISFPLEPSCLAFSRLFSLLLEWANRCVTTACD